MRTVMLAGGFGTRLKSVLRDFPKPLAPVVDKCFLEFSLNQLKEHGLEDFTLCLYYMPEKFIEYFGDGNKFGVKINYNIEEKPLGTGGALGLLRGQMNETFCVLNADTYMELDIQDLLAAHKKRNTVATIAIARVDDISRFGSIGLDGEGFLKGFYEKDEKLTGSGYINAGLYVFEPEIFDYIPENRCISLEREVLPVLLENKIFSYPQVKNFFDIGIPSDYYRFQRWIERNS